MKWKYGRIGSESIPKLDVLFSEDGGCELECAAEGWRSIGQLNRERTRFCGVFSYGDGHVGFHEGVFSNGLLHLMGGHSLKREWETYWWREEVPQTKAEEVKEKEGMEISAPAKYEWKPPWEYADSENLTNSSLLTECTVREVVEEGKK